MIERSTKALLAVLVAAAIPLAACGERAQTAGQASTKKSDAKAWEGPAGAYTVSGWQPGDKDSWESELKARALRGQNEYTRSTAAAGEAKAP
jgi:hypothetical protein